LDIIGTMKNVADKLLKAEHPSWGGGCLGEDNNFYQKNNSPFGRLSCVPFGRVKLFLPVRGKNL
jgi:hypothetical protein